MAQEIQGTGGVVVGSDGKASTDGNVHGLNVYLPSIVDSEGNPSVPGNYVNNNFEADAGTVTKAPLQKQGDISANYRQRMGIDTLLFNECFNGSAINSANFFSVVATQAIAVAGGFLTLNSAGSVATSAVSRVQSYQSFPAYGAYPLQLELEFVYGAAYSGVANNTCEMGFGFAATTAAPTDGVFFRWAPDGTLRAIVNYAGTETISDPLSFGIVAANVRHHANIVVGNDYAEFWIDNILLVNLPVSAANGMAIMNQSPPLLFRNYNSTSTAPVTAVKLNIANVCLTLGDMNCMRDWASIQAGMGGGSYQGQTGQTMGPSANYTNSAAPAAASLSNTTPNYATIDGQWSFAAPAGAETDFAIFGFQVPAGAAATPAKMLVITGIGLSSINTGAAVATTATVLQWALGLGSTTATLATAADAAAVKMRRIVPVGFQCFAVGAGIGANAQNGDINLIFAAPKIAEPGTYVHLICRVPIGTATGSQVMRGTYRIDGYWT